MNLFIRTLILSLAIFCIHILLVLLIPGNAEGGGYYSGLGAIIFYFVFGYWGYFILSGIYIYTSRNDLQRKFKYIKALIIILVGYVLFRVPDIIDDDFFSRFEIRALLFFLLLMPVLVEFENLLRKSVGKSQSID